MFQKMLYQIESKSQVPKLDRGGGLIFLYRLRAPTSNIILRFSLKKSKLNLKQTNQALPKK